MGTSALEEVVVDLGTGPAAAWRVAGAPPPVICVHGAGVSSRELRPFLAASSGRRETWAVDLPGFGASAGSGAPVGAVELAEWVLDWLTAAEIGEAPLLGVSFGCQVVVEAALRAQRRVPGVVLVGPTTDPLAASLPRQIARWFRNSVHEPVSLAPLTLRDYREAGARRAWAAFAESAAHRVQDELPHLDAPVLVVRGEHDALVPQAWAEEVTRLLPGGRLVVWPRAAHMVPFSDPEGLAARVDRFVAEVVG